MWLATNTWQFLLWFQSILKKTRQVALHHTIAASLLALSANLLQVLAFFLPLKVLILLGSETIPWYFVEVFGRYPRDQMTTGLAAGSVAAYIGHLIANFGKAKAVEKGAQHLISHSGKIHLYENQDELAKDYYRRICAIVAACLFGAFALIFGLSTSTRLVALFALSMMALYGIVAAALQSEMVRETAGRNLSTTTSLLSGTSFLTLFVLMIVSYNAGTAKNITYLIAILILGRNVLQQVAGAIADATFLSRHRTKATALFYVGQHLPDPSQDTSQLFRRFGDPDYRHPRFTEAISEALDAPISDIQSTWFAAGIPGVMCFDAQIQHPKSETPTRYLIKLYAPGRTMPANHETTLLGESWAHGLPSHELAGVHSIDGCPCLIYLAGPLKPASPKDYAETVENCQRISWAVKPSDEIVSIYSRSRATLAQRIVSMDRELLRFIAADLKLEQEWSSFMGLQQQLLDVANNTPLFVLNYAPSPSTVLYGSGPTQPRLIHWAQWSIEPVGAGFPTTEKKLSTLAPALSRAKLIREDLDSVTPEQVCIVAHLFELERLYAAERFDLCLDQAAKVVHRMHMYDLPTW